LLLAGWNVGLCSAWHGDAAAAYGPEKILAKRNAAHIDLDKPAPFACFKMRHGPDCAAAIVE